uniref:Uncharacterized protein n=1 Tax=Ditylenchus dipsaci TaxID=166011 RepID=A0A915EQG7_9BILA
MVPNPEQWTTDGCICMQCQNGVMRKSYSYLLKNDCVKEEQYSLRSRPSFKETAKDYKRCLEVVDRFISLNDFNKVDLSVVFAPLFKFPNKS